MASSFPSLGRAALAMTLMLGCVGDAPTVVSCVLGTVSCDGACVNLERSAAHCGACGNTCDPGESCVDGGCTCVGTRCDDVCVDLASHPAHCGACDAACLTGSFCDAGTCATTCSDGLSACDGA